jgi:hypothetical protein
MNTSQDTATTAFRYEWANYAQVAYLARAVPGVEARITSDMVMFTAPQLPSMEVNQAGLLRAEPECADELIKKITQHYRDLGIQPCIAVSPASAPGDLPQRLEAQGYEKFGEPEIWLKLVDASYLEKLAYPPGITVRQIGKAELPIFCKLMVTAFEMPDTMISELQRGLEYTVELPGLNSYIAYAGNEPVGCVSMNTTQGYSAIGSGGVLPGARRLGVSYALWKRTYEDWKKSGSSDYVLQTVQPILARLLRMGGCQQLFTRTYYVQP